MTVLNARNELDALTALRLVDRFSQMLVQVVDEHTGIIGLQITAIVGDNLTVFKCNDITTDGEIVICHIVANAGGFKGTASLIDFVQVVAENSGVSHLTAWRKTFGDCNQPSATSFAGQPVHIFGTRILQGRLVTKTFNLVVGHAVAQNDNVFHKEKRLDGRTVQHTLNVSDTHNVGKDTSSSHGSTGTIALNEHGIFLIALGSEQHNVV